MADRRSIIRESLLLLREIYRRLYYVVAYTRSTPVILIFQMGKVGSTSVYQTLVNSKTGYKIIHAHILSERGIENASRHHRNKGWYDPLALSTLKTNRIIREKLLQTSPDHLKIITLVREPVSRTISNYFENRFRPDNYSDQDDIEGYIGEISSDLNALFGERIRSGSQEERWLKNELYSVFGFDVFAHTFNKEAGFSIYDEKNSRIIVSTMENLDSFMRDVLPGALSINHTLNIQKRNTGDEKRAARLYKTISSEYRLDRDICEQIYSERYVRYFYTDQMIDSFIRKWSR